MKILIKPELQGGFTINGVEMASSTGLAPNGTVARYLNFAGLTPSTNTDGSLISTGSTWVNFPTANQTGMKLLLSTSATSGDFATLRMRARADAAGNAICGNFSASAGANNYGNLYAVQGYAQPNTYTQGSGSNIVCGLYSCIDKASGATSGRHWSLWTDEHSNVKASGGHYLHRLSNNSTNSTIYDGIWTIYAGAGCTYLMNFEGLNAPVSTGDKTGGAKSYALNVCVNGVIRHIQLYD